MFFKVTSGKKISDANFDLPTKQPNLRTETTPQQQSEQEKNDRYWYLLNKE